MNGGQEKLRFESDYMEGAHPAILERLVQTNMAQTPGYGTDAFSESAREKIRQACDAPEAEIHFLVGGTQTNETVISAMLRPYQGVIAAATGHIATHEAGAIESGGHKVITLPQQEGKISPEAIRSCASAYWEDGNREHMVMPGMVYLSQPTEYGTLYSLREMEEISAICREFRMALYVDGARLAYALACAENDVTLPDLARLCDAFYIGGTKCGALLGEAVVFPRPQTVPHFFSIVKQRGALLAKGRIAGIQFDTLFTDNLYGQIGRNAVHMADRIRAALREKGYLQPMASPTNQIFVTLTGEQAARLAEKVALSFWENVDADHVIMRIATSWATRAEDVDRLIEWL
ncbi:MAG: low specificity L-threonine aldolase [Clostridia bacterium]|nr:low specificity L-threonine aldolase [Clostridia bacterium]